MMKEVEDTLLDILSLKFEQHSGTKNGTVGHKAQNGCFESYRDILKIE